MASRGREIADPRMLEGRGVEVGSFRDPASRVVVDERGVFRLLSAEGVEGWQALAASPLLAELVDSGRLVATEQVDPSELGAPDAEGALRHERIPFVSYPYEWTFSMLKDAALLHLEIGRRALEHELDLKDASSYNVQWRGARPVFIDVGSFETLRPGEPWVGYRQFCMLFLYPLMLQAYLGVPFHSLLRGSIDGIAPADARALLASKRMRRGVFSNVMVHARLEGRHSDESGGELKREISRAGFSTELRLANLRKLEKLVRKLEWEPGQTAWTGYGAQNTYTEDDARVKADFVRTAAAAHAGGLVWDVGCNDGTYSRIAAEHARYVVAMDADHATVDALYASLQADEHETILPLVVSVTDPSPDLGWRGLERASLERRGTPDLALHLAVIHHVCITGNIPVREFVEWLRSLGSAAVVEFPHRDDPMVQRLLSAKREPANPDYELETFDAAFKESFEVSRVERLPSGTRTLYEARPKA